MIVKSVVKKSYLTDLRAISKLAEAALNQQLTSYLEFHNIDPPNQSWFRKNHSSVLAFSSVTIECMRAIYPLLNKQMSSHDLLDFSREFHSINYSLLNFNLHHCGIKLILNWLSDYLINRPQGISFIT